MSFRNRSDAGRQLSGLLGDYADRNDVLVLGLPRGGVVVAAEVAQRLHAPLDVWLVRKIGVPGHPELAMGAIASRGVEVRDDDLIASLEIPPALVQQVIERERAELERQDRAFRGDRAAPDVRGRVVIVVDDGLATGATMEAAIAAIRQLEPAEIVAAVPVGSREAIERIGQLGIAVACPDVPAYFRAVGQWYEDFAQTTDEDVRRLLGYAAGAADRYS